MHQRTLSLILVGALALSLFGCDMTGNRVATASEIIKKNLRSPSSFSLISGKEVWSGKDSKGISAYIVRIEYDAQNGFGAIIRDCQLVAFTINDDKYKPAYRSTEVCESKSLSYNESQMIETLRKFNYPHSKP